MREEKSELDIDNLTGIVSELQQEVQLIKNEVGKLRLNTLIEKLHVFIENSEEQFKNMKQDIYTQKQDIEQLKQSLPKNLSRRPSEFRQLQKMLQSVKQNETIRNPTNKFTPTKVEITSIKSKYRRP
ncbi:hypothetical protein JCM21714_1700 [Gracilibacillus boraciitolerans JCM 21714]|uniref:Uncharacterized protein n=1 Tax=Gracilibacillus boraciitolerans JCM 21714 TaxID=1298598 RepID=W4VIV6_9BACI|nr:hypothetical protein [Gracilibacillus boraciitolerans]GAE92689.1 hypothetical protein JCM21714_1700 [Gracilibacillus boraciitolerans JCM 21714]